VVELPTGVGFCLYIRRDCLAEVGLFDAEAFGRGYGEENDFCMRASALGWKHLCHTGVYVEHVGGASFGDERHQLMASADQVLAKRYPDYQSKVERFLEDDPLAPYRDALTRCRLHDSEQHDSVMREIASERAALKGRYYADRREQRDALAKLNAEYTSIIDELREANRRLVTEHQILAENHEALADEVNRVRAGFREAESQLDGCRKTLVDVQQQLEVITNERAYYAAEVERVNGLWHMRVGRRIKRLLRL
jgi:hypothetical protein